MVSIKELAAACGMSVAAVSKAMNNRKGISPENAEKVRQKAQELGYFANAAASTMRTNRSHNIGILFRNDMAHEYFSLVLDAIRKCAAESGYDITFLEEGNMNYLEHALYRQCDGVIVSGGEFDIKEVQRLIESDLPLVSIDHFFEGRSVIYGNNEESMRETVKYLYDLGHRKIAFLHGEMSDITKQRLEGFKKEMHELGLKIPEGFIERAEFRDPKASGKAVKKLLALTERPTAVIFPDDISAIGGMTAIEEAGLSIPGDISCFGYDGIRLAGMLRPTLATYHQDAEGIGRAAVKQLLYEMENKDDSIPRVVTIPGQIQEGGTVCRSN